MPGSSHLSAKRWVRGSGGIFRYATDEVLVNIRPSLSYIKRRYEFAVKELTFYWRDSTFTSLRALDPFTQAAIFSPLSSRPERSGVEGLAVVAE